MKPLFAVLALLLAFASGCNASSNGLAPVQTGATTAQARFVNGAPVLETGSGGTVVSLGAAYLQFDAATIASQFPYGSVTQYVSVLGTHPNSIELYDATGYSVGPIAVPPLSGGKSYSLVLVGSYPNYRILAFEDPLPTGGASIVVRNAASQYRDADFGTFDAASASGYVKRGSVAYGSEKSVSLGTSVTNLGAYAGTGTTPFPNQSSLTLASVDSFDGSSSLPFNASGRLSLFIIDQSSDGSAGPLLGVLDR
ncbi:MAG TPA: hypothetical protein VMH02_11770 [Verrucomicrobiae bacterium]|nr:hypothetical protein [Verrucomicrobiae bacterium]